MFGYDRLLAMIAGVEGGKTALKLARLIVMLIFLRTVLCALAPFFGLYPL